MRCTMPLARSASLIAFCRIDSAVCDSGWPALCFALERSTACR